MNKSRILAWDKHIDKSSPCVQQTHTCKDLIAQHDSTWLLFRRAAFAHESGRTLAFQFFSARASKLMYGYA